MREDDQVPTVGAQLAELRHRAGITGAQLAGRIRASQAKVSKIENGAIRPKPADIIAIGRALDAPEDLIRTLVGRAEREPRRFDRWRPAGASPGHGQQDISGLETRAEVIRSLQVAVPPGLLHTAAYARAVLSDYKRPLDDVRHLGPVPAEVTARIRRQEILADPAKTFLFAVSETALLNRVAKPAVMLGQVERIREAAEQPNVLVRVLRSDTELVYPPLHDFELLDGGAVIVDTMTTTVVSREPGDLTVYRRVFEYFWEQATEDIGPVLDHYVRLYAELARTAVGAAPDGPPTAAELVAPPAGWAVEGDSTGRSGTAGTP